MAQQRTPPRRLTGPDKRRVWQSLAERLEAYAKTTIDSAAASMEFLKQMLDGRQGPGRRREGR